MAGTDHSPGAAAGVSSAAAMLDVPPPPAPATGADSVANLADRVKGLRLNDSSAATDAPGNGLGRTPSITSAADAPAKAMVPSDVKSPSSLDVLCNLIYNTTWYTLDKEAHTARLKEVEQCVEDVSRECNMNQTRSHIKTASGKEFTGHTPLLWAVGSTDPALVACILKFCDSEDVNFQSGSELNTALNQAIILATRPGIIHAFKANLITIIHTLRAHQALDSVSNSDGKTARVLVSESKDPELCKIFNITLPQQSCCVLQ
jgi:hypothetical protein